MMSKIFVYPKADKMVGSPNPYINNFIDALSKDHVVVNSHAKNKGVFNLFKYLFGTEIYIFNWIENLPEKRFGKLQVILFVIFMRVAKLFGKKILWILHNKSSHHRKGDKWVNFLFNFMMKNADKIITHSNSGLDFAKAMFPQYAHKVEVITHPVAARIDVEAQHEKIFDFIIWGSIFPYKGIDKFLSFLKDYPCSDKYKILLVGKCFDKKYKSVLQELLTDNITFYDEIFDLKKIAEFSQQSKFTLFTYKSESVISSGSLIDAIRMGATIIGPNHAAFKDLSAYSFLETYDSFENIFTIHQSHVPAGRLEQEERIDFCEANSWEIFIKKLKIIIKDKA